MLPMKSRSWRLRDKFRQDSSESTSTQASVSIREFELFREFCTTENLATAATAADSTAPSSSFDTLVWNLDFDVLSLCLTCVQIVGTIWFSTARSAWFGAGDL